MIGSADETLPLTRQFALGGQHNFYGLREFERRGRQILVGSLEYRFQSPFVILFDTYFSLRYDLGSIWLNREQIRFKDLRHGVGAAISFNTPVGPAEFAVGKSFTFSNDGGALGKIIYGQTIGYFSFGYYLDH
jgi:NTE family protein